MAEQDGPLDKLAESLEKKEGEETSLRFMLSVYFSFRGGARKLLGVSFLSAIGGGMS